MSLADNQFGTPETTSILSEILTVLKHIDSHLEVQDRHFKELDEQVSALNEDTARTQSILTPIKARAAKFQQSGQSRRGNARTSTRRRDLGSLSTSRASQSSSNHAPESPLTEVFEKLTSWKTESMSPTTRQSVISRADPSSRSGTWDPLLPSRAPHIVCDNHDHDLEFYSHFPPPESWIAAQTQGKTLEVKYASNEAQKLWTCYVGDSWTIPPDGRVEMTFQRHLLERLTEAQAVSLLATLQEVGFKLEYQAPSDVNKRGCFKVTDYEFDLSFEESVAEYRAEIPVGKFRKHPVNSLKDEPQIKPTETAPWKRIIEIRGLSKKLIDEHETWTSNFRDIWNEAIPIMNSTCPFLTNRVNHTTLSRNARIIDSALLHHQQCWRRPPANNHDMCFHITFYELIDLAHENELEGELWRYGKLHSDIGQSSSSIPETKSRRIRESACTLVMTPDPIDANYWTLLILIPNEFIFYDATHNYEQYDTITQAIRGADAGLALQTMISSTIRLVISRWEDISECFAQRHREILSDPDAHDRLLFDDDSFSRSRRYFWAINYLAELELSISANIVEVERFVKGNKTLAQQLSQNIYASAFEARERKLLHFVKVSSPLRE